VHYLLILLLIDCSSVIVIGYVFRTEYSRNFGNKTNTYNVLS